MDRQLQLISREKRGGREEEAEMGDQEAPGKEGEEPVCVSGRGRQSCGDRLSVFQTRPKVFSYTLFSFCPEISCCTFTVTSSSNRAFTPLPLFELIQ